MECISRRMPSRRVAFSLLSGSHPALIWKRQRQLSWLRITYKHCSSSGRMRLTASQCCAIAPIWCAFLAIRSRSRTPVGIPARDVSLRVLAARPVSLLLLKHGVGFSVEEAAGRTKVDRGTAASRRSSRPSHTCPHPSSTAVCPTLPSGPAWLDGCRYSFWVPAVRPRPFAQI